MAGATAALEKFANMAILTVTESAANTLTFKKLEAGISLSEKVAWLIHKIEYNLNSVLATVFGHSGDALYFGLAVSSSFTAVTMAENLIIDWNTMQRCDIGTAANARFERMPLVKDLSTLPNGGIIVPPNPLYGYAQGVGLESATGFTARIYYSMLKLAVEDYWELVEARRVISS